MIVCSVAFDEEGTLIDLIQKSIHNICQVYQACKRNHCRGMIMIYWSNDSVMAGLKNGVIQKYKTEVITTKTLTVKLEDHFKAGMGSFHDNHLDCF